MLVTTNEQLLGEFGIENWVEWPSVVAAVTFNPTKPRSVFSLDPLSHQDLCIIPWLRNVWKHQENLAMLNKVSRYFLDPSLYPLLHQE